MYENLFMPATLPPNFAGGPAGTPLCAGNIIEEASNNMTVSAAAFMACRPTSALENSPAIPHYMTSPISALTPPGTALPPIPGVPPMPPASTPGGAGAASLTQNTCHGCLLPIVDNVYLSVADFTTWHVPCLRCSDCSVGLDSEKSCFIKIGKYLCKKCYQRRFKPSTPNPAICGRCNLTIHAKEMVMHAKDFVYHVNCFSCTHCNRVLTTGDHFGMRDALIFCRQHFEMLSSANLSSSSNPHLPPLQIPHTGCLPPPHSLPPPPVSMGATGNLHQDFHALAMPFPNGSPVSAIAGYHPPSSCSPYSQTPPHSQMGLPPFPPPPPGALGGDAGLHSSYPLPQSDAVMGAVNPSTAAPKAQKGRPKKKKSQPEDPFHSLYGSDLHNPNIPTNPHDAVLGLYMAATNHAGGGPGSLAEQQNRTKRVRTSFKNHQLRVLKQYFQLNHNPDAKELKQLSQKTGLSKRVLQVWFQNARAKYRRLMMKNQQNGTNAKLSFDDENSEESALKMGESDDEDEEGAPKGGSHNNPNSPSAESISDFGEMLSPELSDTNSPSSTSVGAPSEKHSTTAEKHQNNSSTNSFALPPPPPPENSNTANEPMSAF